jgi:hypothetical protein
MESIETATRLGELRDKAERGEKLTQEEEKEAIALVRGDRRGAAIASKTARTKSPASDPGATLKKIADLLGKK